MKERVDLDRFCRKDELKSMLLDDINNLITERFNTLEYTCNEVKKRTDRLPYR